MHLLLKIIFARSMEDNYNHHEQNPMPGSYGDLFLEHLDWTLFQSDIISDLDKPDWPDWSNDLSFPDPEDPTISLQNSVNTAFTSSFPNPGPSNSTELSCLESHGRHSTMTDHISSPLLGLPLKVCVRLFYMLVETERDRMVSSSPPVQQWINLVFYQAKSIIPL